MRRGEKIRGFKHCVHRSIGELGRGFNIIRGLNLTRYSSDLFSLHPGDIRLTADQYQRYTRPSYSRIPFSDSIEEGGRVVQSETDEVDIRVLQQPQLRRFAALGDREPNPTLGKD